MSACCDTARPSVLARSADRRLRVALVGNPNVGKSSVFNRLTGLRQHVGNWPGKTVERRDGLAQAGSVSIVLTDLPGVYSLSPYTLEEQVARDFLLHDPPDVIVNVVDASNLDRNLYLTSEVLELDRPVIVVLTMLDVARSQRASLDPRALSRALGVPVIPVSTLTGEGIDTLLQRLASAGEGGHPPPRGRAVDFSPEIEAEIERLSDLVPPVAPAFASRWAAVKLAEDDPSLWEDAMRAVPGSEALRHRLPARLNGDSAVRIADERYRWIEQVADQVRRRPDPGSFTSASDRIDRVLAHPWFGAVAAVLLVTAGIWATFRVSAPIQEAIEGVFGALGAALGRWTQSWGPPWLAALVRDGLVVGVGTVASFLPLVGCFFLYLGLLEDSGYFARAAFVADRMLGRFGLHGKAGIGLIVGFGCNVPAVMAARNAPGRGSRLLSIVLSPLVICSARLVVIGFVASALFRPALAAAVVASLYLLSVSLVLALALLFRRTAVRETEEESFFIELPPYHIPGVREVGLYAWQKSVHFAGRAITVIAPMTVMAWALSYWPGGRIETSFLAAFGQALTPLGAPLGLDWRMMVALLAAFPAKEGALSTLSVLYGTSGGGALAGALQAAVSAPQALAFLVFFTFYSPCLATVLTIRQEAGSGRWAAFTVAYGLVVSWLLAFAAYRLATWAGVA